MDNMEYTARAWHKDSDHAHDGAPFGGPTCNCPSGAKRLSPMLADAWDMGYNAGKNDLRDNRVLHTRNPHRGADK